MVKPSSGVKWTPNKYFATPLIYIIRVELRDGALGPAVMPAQNRSRRAGHFTRSFLI
jgi:hypothetical protein